MSELKARVAVATGASRGVGRGVAGALAQAGATVFATGRGVAATSFPAGVVAAPCDHTDDAAVAAVSGMMAIEFRRRPPRTGEAAPELRPQ